jgi:hypothetical protein
MRKIHPGVLCAIVLWVHPLFAQSSRVAPVQLPVGSVLTFYLQTRLNPNAENPLDGLPKGTMLRVRLLDAIDSNLEADGAAFRGILDAPLTDEHKTTLVEEHAEVRGLLVLLRSRTHPEGFRYELLLTGINVNGKMQDLTAILNPTFGDHPKPAQPEKPPVESNPADTANAVGQPSPGSSNN